MFRHYVARGIKVYVTHLKINPWRTQALTTAGIMGGGDLLAQTVIEKRYLTGDIDLRRTLRFFSCGLLVFGPGMHIWYKKLDHFFLGRCSLAKAATSKLLLDQGFFLPFYLVVYIILIAGLRGDNGHEIQQQIKKDFSPMLLTSYMIWPPVQAVSFACIPGTYRVLLINVVNLFWNTYLAWKAEQK